MPSWIGNMSFLLAAILLPVVVVVSADGVVELDDAFVDLVIQSMELAAAVQTKDPDIMVEGAILYGGGSDAALFAKINNLCFAVFDGTELTSVADWLYNLDPAFSDFCNDITGQCCKVRNGFRRAYVEPNYRDALEKDVRDCVLGGGDAVVVGASQGGAIAPIAAIALADVEPTLITFGGPGSISGDCPPLDMEKFHRFVNTVVAGNDLDYDPIPALNWFTDHQGQLYLMGDDTQNMVHYGNGKGPNGLIYGYEYDAHLFGSYLKRVRTFRDMGPIGTLGWAEGFACNEHEECIDRCVNGKCRGGLQSGESCNPRQSFECLSDQCRNKWSRPWDFRCV